MVVLTELASPNDVRHFAVAGKVLGAFRMGTNLQNTIKLKYDLIHLKASGINGLKKRAKRKGEGAKAPEQATEGRLTNTTKRSKHLSQLNLITWTLCSYLMDNTLYLSCTRRINNHHL
jgi:hypothetical protein